MVFRNDFPDLKQEHFPALRPGAYTVTSRADNDYNCIAWAAGDSSRCWDDEDEDLYWPTKATIRDGTLASLIEAFSTLEFELCESGELEPSYERIAIYGVGVTWCHVAKQLSNGHWSSKCGKLDDLSHNSVGDVYCDAYGIVRHYMRRRKRPPDAGE